MAVITFLSDFGEKDHYVAAVKATLLSSNPLQSVVDISHQVDRHDISHAAYVLSNVFREFPKGTVHLVSVDPVSVSVQRVIAIDLEGHYFIVHDSGIASLISRLTPEKVVLLGASNTPFDIRNEMADAALKLVNGESLNSLGAEITDYQIRTDRQLKMTKREIVGQVIHVDHYGNLISNIRKADFEKICEVNSGNPGFIVRFGKDSFSAFHESYSQVDEGDCFVLFNSYDFIEIGINKGRADQLLGLRKDTPVVIEFNI